MWKWIVRSTREHVEINNTEQLCRPYTTQWEFASALSCGGPFSRITNISLPFVAVAERGRGATKGRGARLNIKVPQVVLLPSDSTSLMRPHAESTPVRPCITHGVGKVRGKTCRRKKTVQLLTLNRYTWHVMTDGHIHASCISTPPPQPNTHPRSLFYSHVSCRICFHTTLVLQSRRHSRNIYLYSFRTGGPKDSSGPGGEMSRHRARRRSPGRFNSQVRLAALATAADHPSVSAVRAPPACVLFTQPPFRFAA